jgi:hypothetical protein
VQFNVQFNARSSSSMRTSIISLAAIPLGAMLTMVAAAEPAAAPGDTVRFVKRQLDAAFRSEGVAVGDYNRDGKLDIAAGTVWFAAPDWQMRLLVPEAQEYDPKGYSKSFCNFAEDMNGDGWTDIIVVGWPGDPTTWLENPKSLDAPWKRHVCVPVTNNESPQYVPMGKSARRSLLFAAAEGMAYATPVEDPYAGWATTVISAKGAPGTAKYDHGLGAGDVNGDGLIDVIVPKGWWEAPASPGQGEWTFHAVNFGGPCAHMHVFDYDGDGDADVLSSSAHAYGIWWHEQLPEGKWQTHLIDKSFSQTHALELADINGDGLPDFVTGKRWWAHAKGDPGVDEPAVFYWFELTRKDGRPHWIPHQFDVDSGPGTQFQVIDVDGDGLLDVVSSNKKGTHFFRQTRN